MNFDKNYSPGLGKLLYHLDHLKRIKNGEKVAPLHVSVWPNSKCNLKCKYCCGKNIKTNLNELSLKEFKDTMDILSKYGTLAIEFSGVIGEPTLWSYFSDGITYAYEKGLKLSLITNGLLLENTSRDILSKFSWLRVSIQSISHLKKINWKDIPTKASASYIVYDKKSLNNINDIHDFCNKNNLVMRIAVARPCSIEWENTVREKVNIIGHPLFFAEKERGKSLGCYMPWIRAAIDWNGYFLPCPSIELNLENEGFIPDNFKLCHISNLEDWILNNAPHDLNYKCNFCNCGKQENDLIYNLLQDLEDVDFV